MWNCLIVILVGTLAFSAYAEENLNVFTPEDKAGELLYAALQAQAKPLLDARDARYEAIKTPEALAAYQAEMKAFFLEQLGDFPERTPLNPQIVDTQEGNGYRLEKVIFESRPGFHVTGLMYLPLTKPPYPAVLVPCGHANNGKAYPEYQQAPILLAKEGIAAFCFDPLGQGERHQMLKKDGIFKYNSTTQHTFNGTAAILLGMNNATYEIWDGMRALDYLESRWDIDAENLGCAGNSGGGTQTAYLMALDDRIKAAAPSCYMTTARSMVDTFGPQDAEQNIHAQLVQGMGIQDYILMRAPKPTLITCATKDFFAIEGTWDAYREAKRMYTRLGHANAMGLAETDDVHGWNRDLRMTMASFFKRWLQGIDIAVVEPEIPFLSEEESWCTETGRVLDLPGEKTVFELNADFEATLAPKRKEIWAGDTEAALAQVRELAGIRPLEALKGNHAIKSISDTKRNGYNIEKILLTNKNNETIPMLLFEPQNATGIYCYVNGMGKAQASEVGGAIEKLVQAGNIVMAIDLPGLGETTSTRYPNQFTQLLSPNWQEFFLAYQMDQSLLGLRAEAILMTLLMLPEDAQEKVHLIATGEAGPAALHAAALEPDRFASVRLENSLESWVSVVQTPEHHLQLANAVHGALKVYDLPDLVNTLGDKITIVNPVDAAGN